MKRIIVMGLIIAVAINVTVVTVGFSLFQNEINQLKSEKSELENLIQNNSTQTTTQPEEQETESTTEQIPKQTPIPEENPASPPSSLEQQPGEPNFTIKPSVPEFTWKFVDYSYDTDPVYDVDKFTGESVMVERSYNIDNRSIEITIKNQAHTPYETGNGNYASLYYGIRLKGHYSEKWTDAPKPRYYGYHRATDSDYTTISLRLASYGLKEITDGGKIDLQIKALIGNDKKITGWTSLGESYYYEFTGETSEWSQTVTITYPQDSEPITSTGESAASLTCNIESVAFTTIDRVNKLAISGNITNSGTRTAYDVELHIQTWFSNGTKGIDEVLILNRETIWMHPFEPVTIAGGEAYSLTSRYFKNSLLLSIPKKFWIDELGELYPFDLVATYKITPIWSGTQ